MWFVMLGFLLIARNLVGIGPTAAWNWQFTGDLWKFTVPFILATLWWWWTDKSGMDKRREMTRMEEKKANRRKENLEALGLPSRSKRKR